ncbi:apolipoprotein N-acyltransferase [Aestuariibius sp. 2305UL40-4]|uniref:apolipoprotein N-acyltransferase n=1 Tax=Aestuariibius violaceus TaxID=3234132 RepID=UPI00345EE694
MPDIVRRPVETRMAALACAHRRPRLGALIGLGALAALGHAPFDLWFLTVVALIIAFGILARVEAGGPAFWSGWAFGFGYFLIGMNWLVEPFLVDVAQHGWMAPFGITFLSAGLALFWGVAAMVAAWLGNPVWWRLIVLVAAIVLVEYLRGIVLTGFPWGMVAYVWIETPLSQALAWIGPHGLTAVTLALAASIAGWLITGERLGAPLSLAVLPGIAAVALAPGPAEPTEEGAPVIRMVQSGAQQNEKWKPENISRFLNVQLDATGAGPAADLTIWSEAAIPYLVDEAGPLFVTMAELARGGSVIAGIQRFEDGRYYNSLVALGEEGMVEAVYDKNHLVPFGEYLPFDALLRRIGIAAIASNVGAGFAHGTERALIDIPGIGPILPLICYEGIFPAQVAEGPRPRLMVLITNDAWFGNFSGPYQHLVQGRARAIEQGVPMVRVAQTGVSAMIDGKGRMTASLELGEAGGVDAALPPELPPTLYARTGDVPALLLMLLTLAVAGMLRMQRNRIDPASEGA